jgi:hypothetical protein
MESPAQKDIIVGETSLEKMECRRGRCKIKTLGDSRRRNTMLQQMAYIGKMVSFLKKYFTLCPSVL